ncbi:hypothetical protein B0T22DRAFT_484437 [Podospora appendiculata]|uniref:Uncharacterized protein n=1 Tax=Podospora appendiculata TaxID=314037 RepID=A0AAE1C825_9PEZI|nr:hypothetical protein B0T22DRAFT_484437 [Podospora appendiculata]
MASTVKMDDPSFPYQGMPNTEPQAAVTPEHEHSSYDADHRDADNMEPPTSMPRRWKWSVTTILIGTSQSGKSTLINRFRSMAIGPHPMPEPANVGQGTFACTKEPFLYEFDIPMTDYVLVEGPRSDLVPGLDDEDGNMERSIFDLGLWKRNDVQVRARNSYADIVRLRVLDTPGLDDDKPEENATNIRKVLQFLNTLADSPDLDKRSLGAVMFVIKAGAPFNDSLQRWYHHYQRCMPNLFGSIAVVNTNYRLKDWKMEYGKRALSAVTFGGAAKLLSSRDRKMKLRREAWADIFHSDPTHFFIDSKPSAKVPFENYSSANTVYDMLLYLRSQGKLPIDNIRLVKFHQMVAVDAQLALCLGAIRALWESDRDYLCQSQSVGHQSLAQHKKNRLMWKNTMDELEKKLELWETDVQFDLNTYSPTAEPSAPAKVWKFCTFRGHENTLEITEKVFPFGVNAPDSDDTVWVSKRQATAADRTWKGTYKSKWRKTPRFTARSWTTNRTYYADEIRRAREQRDELLENIDKTDDIIAKEASLLLQSGKDDAGADENPRLAQLTEWLAAVDRYMRQLREEEVPLSEGFSESAMARYGKPIDKVGYGDVLQLVAETEPELRPAFEVAAKYLSRR